MPKITVEKEAKDVIVPFFDYSKYGAGVMSLCFVCDAAGWVKEDSGYPAGAKNVPEGSLQHKTNCPMNAVLNKDGTIKE